MLLACHMTRRQPASRRLALLAVGLAVALAPLPSRAVTPNRSVAVAVLGAPRAGRTGLQLAAAAWVEEGWEATAALAWWTAGRTGDRAADGGLAPAAGLRWTPDRPGWRPEVAVELGCRWRAGAWRAAALEGLLRGGLEWLPARTAGLGLAAGVRWTAQATPALEVAATGRLYF